MEGAPHWGVNMDWMPVIRELHLSGGCRAFNGMDPQVSISPPTLDDKKAIIKLSEFNHLYKDIKSLKLRIIGCDFFTSQEEAKSLQPPQWRTYCEAQETWNCTEQGDTWSFISNSAFELKNGVLWDSASRISHQIRACEWRLRQLSESYADQLRSSLERARDNESRFKDGYTSLCYLSFQSFLVDACILRDYLSEFYWEAIEKSKDSKKVTTLSGLLKHWKAHPPTDSAGKEIAASAKKGQWLFEIGAYRDLVVHTAPLAQAGKSLFAVVCHNELSHGKVLPGIKLPLPDSPTELINERVSGRYFQDPNLNFARYLNAVEDIHRCRDALEYAHLCMQLLGAMSRSISKASPITPKIPVITPIPGSLKISTD